MPRPIRILAALLAAVFCASLGTLLALNALRPDPLKPDETVRDLALPPFTLAAQDGSPVTRDSLLGRITIVDFFFTRCTLACPLLTQQMVDQTRALRDTPVRFLSINVDPQHETVESIRAYAQEHGADPARWTFALADPPTLSAIAKGLMFDLSEDPKNQIKLGDGATMSNIVHPSWFALIGPNAEVLGIYLATDEARMHELTHRARAAAAKLGTRAQ